MRALVDLEVLATREYFATSGERTRERFLSRVYPYVVNELVFGFERFSESLTVLPVARMVCLLGSSNMFDRQVGDYFVHRVEEFVTACATLTVILP